MERTLGRKRRGNHRVHKTIGKRTKAVPAPTNTMVEVTSFEALTMNRLLSDERLLETGERLRQRIAERFPGSGLSEVAAEVVQLTREALARAESIRRPNLFLRGGLVVLGLLAAAGLVRHFWTSPDPLNQLLQFLDATKGMAAYLAAIAIFFVTLEVRLKRRRAMRAVHELRAMAHLIDMHQLNKDPERAGSQEGPRMESGRAMTVEEIGYYLAYCTELLSIVSKIGQLYVQDFPDTTAQAAVDQFENLATGLSGKIWQKIMILDRLEAEVGIASADNKAAAGPAKPVSLAAAPERASL